MGIGEILLLVLGIWLIIWYPEVIGAILKFVLGCIVFVFFMVVFFLFLAAVSGA